MAFSRQRELVRAQALIARQRRQKIREFRKSSHAPPPMPELSSVGVGAVYSDLDEEENEPSPDKTAEEDLETIFVSIPSYRDPECARTLADCFEKAAHPDRIFAGVFEQNDPNEDRNIDCMQTDTAQHFINHIRRARVVADEARGPVYARSVVEQELYAGEDYVFCIDSHTLFMPNWDSEIIRQLQACNSSKPVLTCYPEEYDRDTRNLPAATLPPSFLSFRNFHQRLGLWQQDRVRFAEFPARPMPSLFWAGGFSFARGEIVQEVPFDPKLPYMFLGEESSMAARLYTNGWDTYAPITNIVFHYTPRDYRPVFWEQFYKRDGVCKVSHEKRVTRRALEAGSVERVHTLLRGDAVEAPYGLGTARTLQQFEDFIGLDLQEKKYKKHAKWGLTRNADSEERRTRYGDALSSEVNY